MDERVKALEELRARLREKYKCFNPEKVHIGDFTYGMPTVLSWGEKNAKLKIGKFCSIGANVQIYLGGNHHTDWFTTYPFNALVPEIWGDIDDGVAATKGDVVIGNGVWIGNNVTIMSGVQIGDGAVIANGSVVTKDVYPYMLVAGNPAEDKKWLSTMSYAGEWWEWPLEKIAHGARFLMSHDAASLMVYNIGCDNMEAKNG